MRKNRGILHRARRSLLLLLLGTVVSPQLFAIDANEESLEQDQSGSYDFLVYAVTWQPTFCKFNPDSVSCIGVRNEFYTHGIWPYYKSRDSITNRHPSFCLNSPGCPRTGTCSIEESVLTQLMANEQLQKIINPAPTKMLRHEWEKHGTCSGKKQLDYFTDFINLRHVVKFDNKFLDHLGKETSFNSIKSWFPVNTAFRCKSSGAKQYLFEVFFLLDRNGLPYYGAPDLHIGEKCLESNIVIPEILRKQQDQG